MANAGPRATLKGRPLRAGRCAGTISVDAQGRRAIVRSSKPPSSLSVGYVLEAGSLPDELRGELAPVVGELEVDAFRDGDRGAIDGSSGAVSLDGVERTDVVTAFLERRDGRILLLQRSERVGSFRGRWAGVSGFLEGNEPERQAHREILEETGIEGPSLRLEARGRVAFARDGPRLYAVHPFRFRVALPTVRLDWEHSVAEWVEPAEIRRRPTVPGLDRVWERVAPDEGVGRAGSEATDEGI
ncbi:MAG TPA: NUDIX domain-containing protein [Thermoplasmata archaeon]|nr:NUDIX domain-containing protein [Thermoplasmata archaeon]